LPWNAPEDVSLRMLWIGWIHRSMLNARLGHWQMHLGPALTHPVDRQGDL
jgi:hypothetical protein